MVRHFRLLPGIFILTFVQLSDCTHTTLYGLWQDLVSEAIVERAGYESDCIVYMPFSQSFKTASCYDEQFALCRRFGGVGCTYRTDLWKGHPQDEQTKVYNPWTCMLATVYSIVVSVPCLTFDGGCYWAGAAGTMKEAECHCRTFGGTLVYDLEELKLLDQDWFQSIKKNEVTVRKYWVGYTTRVSEALECWNNTSSDDSTSLTTTSEAGNISPNTNIPDKTDSSTTEMTWTSGSTMKNIPTETNETANDVTDTYDTSMNNVSASSTSVTNDVTAMSTSVMNDVSTMNTSFTNDVTTTGTSISNDVTTMNTSFTEDVTMTNSSSIDHDITTNYTVTDYLNENKVQSTEMIGDKTTNRYPTEDDVNTPTDIYKDIDYTTIDSATTDRLAEDIITTDDTLVTVDSFTSTIMSTKSISNTDNVATSTEVAKIDNPVILKVTSPKTPAMDDVNTSDMPVTTSTPTLHNHTTDLSDNSVSLPTENAINDDVTSVTFNTTNDVKPFTTNDDATAVTNTANEVLENSTRKPMETITKICPCRCNRRLFHAAIKQGKTIQDNLILPTGSVLSKRRKLISATDKRVSSICIGSTSVFILVVSFGLIVWADAITIMKTFRDRRGCIADESSDDTENA